jgi:chromosome segregation ATPase
VSIGSTALEAEKEKPRPAAIVSQLQHIKELLLAPIGTLVQDSTAVKLALEEIRSQLPEALRIKLWPAGHLPFFREKVESAKQRIEARQLQTPLRSEITQRCQMLNEKKSALDETADTSADDHELDALEKELAELEAKIQATKQLIQDKKDSIARSKQEVEDLKAQLQTELEQLRDLSRQVVVGEDKDDEAAIAEADQVRVEAVLAIDEYLM